MPSAPDNKPKNKGGRPRIELSDEQVAQVEKLAAVLNHEQIADFLGIGDQTLRRRMREDSRVLEAYARGRARAIGNVAGNLIQQANKGNVNAARFYLETQAGWKTSQDLNLRTPDGPLNVSVTRKVIQPDAES